MKPYIPADSIQPHIKIPSDIIVYLDYHSKVADGGGDLILDFRKSSDFLHFASQFQSINKENTLGTYIVIRGYTGSKRLMRGCYYLLNVQLLKQAKYSLITDSYLFIAEFDFSDYDFKNNPDAELFQSHEPLDPSEMLRGHSHKSAVVNNNLIISNLQLYVADVGQANWNELRHNGNTIVQYDMGAELHATKQQVDAIYKAHAPNVDPSKKAILVISHWDMDHIHCLCSMSAKDIQDTFSKVWCPDTVKSNTAANILAKLQHALTNANVKCVTPHHHTPRTDYHMHPLQQLNNNIRLYIGENRRNRNHSGIVMFVEGISTSANYTGDCLLSQADEVLQDVLQNGTQASQHILIAPHHGGANPKANMHYTILPPITNTQVCISVGNGNPYGHPDAKMLTYFQSVANGGLMRTDQQGDFIVSL